MYDFKIDASPEFSLLSVTIPANETLRVEASSMASLESHIEIKARLRGGLRRFITKESLFINEYTARHAKGEILVAPGPSGDIGHFYLEAGKTFFLTATSYLASTMGVKQETKWQGFMKGFFSGESFFLIKCTGEGDIWFNCIGALFSVDVRDEYVVDTGHVVAFTDDLEYDVVKLGGYKSLFLSGEGFVCRFRGNGKVWIQTKNPASLVSFAHQYRKYQPRS